MDLGGSSSGRGSSISSFWSHLVSFVLLSTAILMADRRKKADPLCGVVSGILNGYCFIESTDMGSSSNESRNTFSQLPDAFAHKTCFNREEWSSLSLYQSVEYFAEVVKRAHSGDLKMHVTRAWVVKEKEVEEEKDEDDEVDEEEHAKEEEEEQYHVEEDEYDEDREPPPKRRRHCVAPGVKAPPWRRQSAIRFR